jgi:Ca2+-binding RTX toxin-like protein
MTIKVTGHFEVASDQVLDFVDETAFLLFNKSIKHTPELYIGGKVNVISTQEDGFAVGVAHDSGSFDHSLVWNEYGAVFTVSALSSGSSAVGFSSYSSNASFRNDGLWRIRGDETAIGLDSWNGDPFAFDNAGRFYVHGRESALGARLHYGGSFNNDGVIKVNGSALGAIGVDLDGGPFTFSNRGKIIVADESDATDSVGLLFSHDESIDATVFNAGVIRGDYAIKETDNSLGGEPAATLLDNIGVLRGAVDMGDGDDEIDNSGLIDGEVLLGDGDDVYVEIARGTVSGGIYAGRGDDRVIADIGDNVIYGDNGVDHRLDGNDFLAGGRGADALFGEDGADTLSGDTGADTLTGGGGKDLFDYDGVRASSPANIDLITDLTDTDRIDLSDIDADITQIGNQAFTLAGSLSGEAGQAVLSYDPQADLTILWLDIDGDSTADGVITISGDHRDFSNFLL